MKFNLIRQKVTVVSIKKENEFLRVSRLKKGRPSIFSRLAWLVIFLVLFVSRQKGTNKQILANEHKNMSPLWGSNFNIDFIFYDDVANT